jgi:two-component system, chemotaxis family, protein-glutamate methylesterase/glutaminase
VTATEQPLREPARSAAQLAVPDPPIEVVVVGASAGGVEALCTLIGALPTGFPAAVLVVLHVPQAGTSVLPDILRRAGTLPVATALHGEPLLRGRVYVAPPGCHLLVDGGSARLSRGPRENGHRPAIDSLFRSAAEAFGGRVAGVILSGMLDDGTAGLYEIKRRGGTAIVQDPETALYAGMPRSAAEHVPLDALLPLSDVAPALVRVAGSATNDQGGDPVPDDPSSPPARPVDGQSTRFTCPDCGGVLFEYADGPLDRFACSVGHAYSLQSLVDGQMQQLEGALWAAVRIVEDRAVLLRRMVGSSRDAGRTRASHRFEERAQELMAQAELIRTALERGAEPALAGVAAVDQT